MLAVALGFAVCQVAILLTTVYLHRGLAHRAVRFAPWLTWVFRVVTWLTTGIRPRQWVAVHRKHHAFTDVAGDPHSPVMAGWAAVQFGNVWMYRKVANDDATVARYARDLPADRWDRLAVRPRLRRPRHRHRASVRDLRLAPRPGGRRRPRR